VATVILGTGKEELSKAADDEEEDAGEDALDDVASGKEELDEGAKDDWTVDCCG